MFERIETHPINPEDSQAISRAVIIMFPDARTTDGVTPALTREFPDTLPGQFFSTTQKILGRYKHEGYTVLCTVYDDTASETASGLYNLQLFDQLIPSGSTFAKWNREDYLSKLPTIIDAFNLVPQASVVVGGYHAEDCVVEMTGALRRLGYRSSIDLRLTNELPFLLTSHRARTYLGSQAPLSVRSQDRLIWEAKKHDVEKLVEQKQILYE